VESAQVIMNRDSIRARGVLPGRSTESAAGLAGSFATSPCRVTVVGHFHRWLAARALKEAINQHIYRPIKEAAIDKD
jgi:hypothetical protein